MKRQQYTLSLGVCASCHGNPVLEFDSTWNSFSASLCECKDTPHQAPLAQDDASICQNCGIDLDIGKCDILNPSFGSYCSKGCALETKVYSIRVQMYGPSEEEEDSEEEDSEEESYDDTFEGMSQCEADYWITLDDEIHGGE
jgi:hypothetical protein